MSTHPSPSEPNAANTLVLAAAFDNCGRDTCAEMLGATVPDETDVLFVTITGSVDTCLDHWRSRVGPTPPANVGIVTVDESTRSASASTTSTHTAANGRVRSVSSPGDLTGLGIAASEYLSEWQGNGNDTVVCFDSLTPLLQYADTQRVFQFLHVLTRRVESAGATAHFHMDPTAHDDQTVRTIGSLFDEVLELADECQAETAESAESGTVGTNS